MRPPNGPMRSWTGPVTADAPASLLAYAGAARLLTPFAGLALALRRARGKEDPARLCERRGIAMRPRPPGPLVWIHGASVGEVVSVFALIDELAARRPDIGVLLTSGTVSSAQFVAGRAPAGVLHQFAPLDMPRFVDRFLDHWKPDLALVVESELWPNMLAALRRRRIPAALVNARMSPRSARNWRRAPAAIGWLLAGFGLCLAQTAADGERLAGLGARNVRVTGNLKLDAPAPPVDVAKLAALAAAAAGRTVVAAASTHPGEEAVMAEAHAALKRGIPGLLTVIAPRHPERGAAIAEEMRARGLACARRSAGALPDAATDIYLGDTFGELGLVYRLAEAVFMGGSLVPHGGQNPIEPAKIGAAILHGPHVFNFAEIYALLDGAGGARAVASAAELTESLNTLLTDRTACRTMAERAHEAVGGAGGALERVIEALAPLLPPARG